MKMNEINRYQFFWNKILFYSVIFILSYILVDCLIGSIYLYFLVKPEDYFFTSITIILSILVSFFIVKTINSNNKNRNRNRKLKKEHEENLKNITRIHTELNVIINKINLLISSDLNIIN